MQSFGMEDNKTMTAPLLKTSVMADQLIPSEIIKLANDIHLKMQAGEEIFNLTIGDFDPKIFPIPAPLTRLIVEAYQNAFTNYPMANGMPELRKAVSKLLSSRLSLEYTADEILVSSGARPLIYALYKTLLDPGDKVIFPVPSWNNNHYCHLCGAEPIEIEVSASDHFMPTANVLKAHLQDATLLALCSPQNPTGTIFTKKTLTEICQLVKQENRRRLGHQKPLYIMYDQIYWELCFGDARHEHPVLIEPELRDCVVSIDGMSKAFAATGIRVGWAFGPNELVSKMRAILSHVGAWAPKPEQMACAWFLNDEQQVEEYLNWFKEEVDFRLQELYHGIHKLKQLGYPIDVIEPQAAIYLTIQLPWVGQKPEQHAALVDQKAVTDYVLNACKVGLVPFKAFGASIDSNWYRISVGTLKRQEIPLIVAALRKGMDQFIKHN